MVASVVLNSKQSLDLHYNMDAKSAAEFDLLIAADRWARDVMRNDKHLDRVEQHLMDTIVRYQRLLRSLHEAPVPDFPKAPPLPKNILKEYGLDMPEKERKKHTTIPSPPEGTSAVRDIEWVIDLKKD